MTEFQKKRLAYFIKAAKNNDWVRLGPGDDELFKKLLEYFYMYKDLCK